MLDKSLQSVPEALTFGSDFVHARHRLESVLERHHPEYTIKFVFIIIIEKMAAIVLPAARRHTSTVIVMHGLGDR